MKEQTRLFPQPKPFVKWAGGKRQLLPVLCNNMPKMFNKYYEPFLGGGALFFNIVGKGQHSYHISDLNCNIVLAYTTIRDHAEELIDALITHSKEYNVDSKSYYYHVRDDYDDTNADAIETVSRLIFLNKTCFNGLYRVNSSGKFNVPIGRYVNPTIADAQNIRAVSDVLNQHDVHIKCQDFGHIIKYAQKGDFIYFDPPYLPVSKTASFTMYTGVDFDIDDQKKMAELCAALDEKDCHVLVSNSDSDVISDMFTTRNWTIEHVDAVRCINSNSRKRHGHRELLIKNY